MSMLKKDVALILPFFLVVSSLSRSIDSTVKRTNAIVINKLDDENKRDAKIALLWGRSAEESESTWYENFERLLGGSHSYSYSGDDDDDDDDDKGKGHHDHIIDAKMDQAPITEHQILSTETSNLEQTSIYSSDDVSTNSTGLNETASHQDLADPSHDIKEVTHSPTPSPTLETGAPSDVSDETFSEDISEENTDPESETNQNDEVRHKKIRKCGLEAAYHEANSKVDVFFSYAAETKSKLSSFIAPLEDEILDIVTSAILQCHRNNGERALRAFRKLVHFRRLNVVSVDSTQKDHVSQTYSCVPTDSEANHCTVVNGVITLGLTEDDEGRSEREALTIIKKYMEDNTFVSSEIPDLIKVRYLGPDIPAEPEQASSTEVSSATSSTESNIDTSFIALISMGSVLIVLLMLRVCIKRRVEVNKKSDEDFVMEMQENGKSSEIVEDIGQAKSNDTESDTS